MLKSLFALFILALISVSSLSAETASHPASKATAKVYRASFQQVSSIRGRWSGFVAGDGLIQLVLKILKNGKTIRNHRIGQVSRTKGERPTSFEFNAPLPSGKWSWKISAINLPHRLARRHIP